MPNIGALLREEIARLGRKEVRQSVAPLRKASAVHRKDIAELKRKIDAQHRLMIAKLTKRLAKGGGESNSASPDDDGSPRRRRFVAKGLVSLRKRLGVSRESFAILVGVSPQSIYNWEKESSTPRPAQLEKLIAVRSMGKREVAERLERAAGETTAAAPPASRKKTKTTPGPRATGRKFVRRARSSAKRAT